MAIREFDSLTEPSIAEQNKLISQTTKYPVGLIEEYQQLVSRELDTPLSPAEQARLQQLMAQIAKIDADDPGMHDLSETLDSLESRLEQLRCKIESLPDAGTK